MSDNTKSEAKKLFFRYGCNHFYMWKEGEINKYESFGISEEQENLWRIEYQNGKIKKIRSENDVNKLTDIIISLDETILQNNNIDIFRQLIESIKENCAKQDSFTKLLISEQISETVKELRPNNSSEQSIIKDGKMYARSLAENVLKTEITVAPVYHKYLLEDDLTKEQIMERAKEVLKELQNPA